MAPDARYIIDLIGLFVVYPWIGVVGRSFRWHEQNHGGRVQNSMRNARLVNPHDSSIYGIQW